MYEYLHLLSNYVGPKTCLQIFFNCLQLQFLMHITLIGYYTWPDAKYWEKNIETPVAGGQTILAHKFKLSKLPQFGPAFKSLDRIHC